MLVVYTDAIATIYIQKCPNEFPLKATIEKPKETLKSQNSKTLKNLKPKKPINLNAENLQKPKA